MGKWAAQQGWKKGYTAVSDFIPGHDGEAGFAKGFTGGFRSLKDPIGMRPIWHTNERRVRAHIFVAALAFLIERMLERALKDAGVPLSAQAALTALQTIRHVRLQTDAEERAGVTPGSARARQVLKALKITELRPPTPPAGPQTTM